MSLKEASDLINHAMREHLQRDNDPLLWALCGAMANIATELGKMDRKLNALDEGIQRLRTDVENLGPQRR